MVLSLCTSVFLIDMKSTVSDLNILFLTAVTSAMYKSGQFTRLTCY